MNIFKKCYCRMYQGVFRIVLPLMPYREPNILDSVLDIKEVLRDKNVSNILLVTDNGLRNLGLTKELEDDLNHNGYNLTVFDAVVPNPTISNIEECYQLYIDKNCEAIVAFGGGSVMDCAKIVGARVVKPKLSVNKMKGVLKINKKLPTLIAVPTTAGTGSEVTVAAVITDETTHYKYAINDFCLIPEYAVLDYKTTIGLPPMLTATTGLDALTHAIEAYIGRSTTKYTRAKALEAIKLIYENLYLAYKDGNNADARRNMLHASYLAGIAFTRSYVGYVHAVAHSLGGQYGVAHGLANAIILPYFLDEYRPVIDKKLANVSRMLQLSDDNDDNKVAADRFVNWLKELNSKMNIPTKIKELKEEDIPSLAKRADKEANPLYPVPKLMNAHQLEKMYYKLLAK